MQKFILAYYGGNRPATQEEGAAHMQNWMSWMNGLGDAVVDAGNPYGPAKTVSASGVSDSSNTLNGTTLVQAETIEVAIEMAKSCPHLDLGGTIDVAVAMQMMPD